MTLVQIINQMLEQYGYVEVKDSVHLHTQEEIEADQKNWHESDRHKQKDFSYFQFWLTGVEGVFMGCDSIEDALEYCFRK